MRILFATKGIHSAFWLWALASCAQASTWYVAPLASGGDDANPGTLTQPFYTFGPAVLAVQPGDTVYVRGGTYHYPNCQWLPCLGTPAAWITFAAYPGETPVIDGSSMPAGTLAIGIGGRYLVLQGFSIQNAPQGIGSWEAGHLRILDNQVSHCRSWGISCGAASFGNATDIVISGNLVADNDQDNNPTCANCGWPAGISTYWASGVTVSGNVSHGNFGEGIAISHSDDVHIIGNTSYDNYSVELYLDNDRFCSIEGNLAYGTFDGIHDRYGTPAIGIACANEAFTPATNPLSDNVIINNVVINGRYGFNYGSFGYGGGMKNFIVANNTFYGAGDTLFQIDPDPGSSNNIIANNVFWQTGGNSMQYMGGPLSAFSFSHNAWYGGSAGVLAGPGDVTSSPGLANAGGDIAADYRPSAGSALIDAGMAISRVTVDYAGAARPSGAAYDIGAFEGPLPTPSPSVTPAPASPRAPEVLAAVPVPQPNPKFLSLHLDSAADEVRVRVYDQGYQRRAQWQVQSVASGWVQLALPPELLGLPNGLYFMKASARGSGGTWSREASGPLVVLR